MKKINTVVEDVYKDWNEWLDECPVGYSLMTMDRETITYRFDVPDDDLDEQKDEEEE